MLVAFSIVFSIIVATIIGVWALGTTWLQDLPDYTDATLYNAAEKTRVYANDGETLLASFYLEDREPVERNQISDYVVMGTIATEDERFYEHDGVDLWGIARATIVNMLGSTREGASTITQQLVRNTILADEADEISLKRKLREAYISVKMEEMYNKDEILLMYLNTINYGSGSHGIEAAAQRYFSKSAAELTLAEAATLVGIPQSPTYNNPIDNPEQCLTRRNLVLSRMLANGYIDQQQHDEALVQPLELNVQDRASDGIERYPYFSSYIRDELVEQYSREVVFQGGLTVYTTLDPVMQEYAEQAARRKEASVGSYYEVALTAVDPDTGFIKAMVGGKDYYKDQWNLATQAQRSPGSSFKTFTLVASIEDQISPQTYVNCSSTVQFPGWKVSNIGGAGYGTISIARAFALSSNTGFARITMTLGPEKVVEVAHRLGITSYIGEDDPTVTLGAYEVTTLEMAGAYASIANGGTKHTPTGIEKVIDQRGDIIFEANTEGTRVLSPEVAHAATEVMKGVVTGGTGTGARLSSGQVAAGKTGTSENYRDSYFCGITPQLSVAIWLGNRQERAVGSDCTSVFRDFVGNALKDQPLEDFPEAEDPPYKSPYEVNFNSAELGYSYNYNYGYNYNYNYGYNSNNSSSNNSNNSSRNNSESQ